MATVEIRCPRCGAPCSSRGSSKDEYHCDHCGAIFNFIDSRESTVVYDTRLHNCPICGRPVKIEEGFVCTQCGKEYVCPECVREVAGKFVCRDCLKNKWLIVGPSEMCPNCYGPLTYVQQYNRWYCYACKQYVQHVCSECGGNARYVPKYRSWWCDTCKSYLQEKKTRLESMQQAAQTSAPQPIIIQTEPRKSGCFIATAAYGTPMTEEISILRRFRDGKLARNPLGKRLVEMYYRLSPPIAKVIARSKKMRALVRLNLKPILHALRDRQ